MVVLFNSMESQRRLAFRHISVVLFRAKGSKIMSVGSVNSFRKLRNVGETEPG
jgi:hypothetical protein